MNRLFFLSALVIAVGVVLACSNSSSANNAQTNSNIYVVPANGTVSPTPPALNTAANVAANSAPGNLASPTGYNALPQGATAPGIDPKNAVIKLKPGATPTPGIPDPETIRRQMQGLQRSNGNANASMAPPGGGMMMQKKPVKAVNKPTP